MTPKSPSPSDTQSPSTPPPPRDPRPGSPPAEPPKRVAPWRTEGLPPGQPPRRRPRWLSALLWLAASFLLFTTLTMQERLSEPDAVPYTEFKRQVDARNVAEVFARGESIEGGLKTDAPLPGHQDQ